MGNALSRISARFAAELVELTNAIERGENIDHRRKVLHEYARTWMMVAEYDVILPAFAAKSAR